MKVLVLRFSAIGDIVLTTPIVRALKNQVDGCELHFATKKAYFQVLSSNPYIDKIHCLDGELKPFIKALKEEKFDFIVDLHNNLRTLAIKKSLKVQATAFSKLNIEKWLAVNTPINKLPKKHIVERYFDAVSKLKVKNDNLGIDFFLEDGDKVDLNKAFQQKESGIAIAIGAKFNTKQIPIELLVEFIRDIELPIYLLGGKEDKEKAEKLKEISSGNLINCCGKLSLRQSAHVIKQSKLLITGDTGLMHIGAAFQTPIVSIWGNTIPEFGMYPYRPQAQHSFSIHEVKDLKCRPCSKIGYEKCPKKHFQCMKNQDIGGIKEQINLFLKTGDSFQAPNSASL